MPVIFSYDLTDTLLRFIEMSAGGAWDYFLHNHQGLDIFWFIRK